MSLTPYLVHGSLASGLFPLPAAIGAQVVWTESSPMQVGALSGVRYVNTQIPALLFVATVAIIDSTHGVSVAWSPSDTVSFARWTTLKNALVSMSLLSSVWAVDADGIGVSAMESDSGANAVAARAAWPAAWRYWQFAGGDVMPDPKGGVAGSGPSGARCLPVQVV